MPWSDIRMLYQPCRNCTVHNDYYSVVQVNIHVMDYEFNIYTPYMDISDWFEKNNYDKYIPDFLNYFKPDHMFIENKHVPKTEIKSFKLFEVIDYLKDFVNSKDLSLNI